MDKFEGMHYINADGKVISLGKYLEIVEEEEKRRKKAALGAEARIHYSQASGEMVSAMPRKGPKARVIPYRPRGKKRVVYTKLYTPDEIREEEEKLMAEQKRLRDEILKNMILFQGKWVKTADWAEGTGIDTSDKSKYATLSSYGGRLYKFLKEKDLMIRKKVPGGRGYVYLFKDKVKPEDVPVVLEELSKEYAKWEKNYFADQRAKRKQKEEGGEPEPKPKKTVEPEESVEVPTFDDLVNRVVEKIGPLSVAVGTEGLKVQVDINIRLGLIK